MADQLKLQEAVTFVQQTPPETYRLLDVEKIIIPTGYSHGKKTIAANTVDEEVATDVNIFVLSSTVGVTLKIGNTTAPSSTNVTKFSYRGAKTSFFISNSGTEDISVTFVSGSE